MLLIQEVFGVNDHIRDIADRLAALGYVVLAPDLFWRLKHNVELGYEGKDLEQALDYFERFDETKGLSDLRQAAEALRNLKPCTGRIGAIGFCLGGKLTYRLAACTNLNVAIAYYGVNIEKYLEEAERIKCQIMLHFGETDDFVPPASIDTIKRALSKKPNFTIHMYKGIGHGFNCDVRESYNQEAADLAWERTTKLLARELLE